MNDYYTCVRHFVVSDPELPDSLYLLGFWIMNVYIFYRHVTFMTARFL